MRNQRFVWCVSVFVVAAVAALPLAAAAQAPEGWTAPRTADGHPDLQGIWANNSATPMERPEQLGDKARLTDEELADLTARIQAFRDAEQAGDLLGDRLIQQALGNAEFQDFDVVTGNYNAFWLVERTLDNRTSLIIDPPNGRRPPLTEAARARRRAAQAGGLGATGSDGPEDRTLGDRCLFWGVPNMGSGYNSYSQIFQTKDQVTIIQEMGHHTRTIPLDRIAPDVPRHEITLNDPDTWTRPWTVELLLEGTRDPIFEYACHEGNYAMPGILAGARAEERAPAAAGGR